MAVRRKRSDAEPLEVYALAAAPLALRARAGRPSLSVFDVGPIAVVVGPRRRAAALTEEVLRQQHALVVSLAEQVDPLLPVRFGTRMTRDRLASVIRQSASVIADALEHVRGRGQMTVRLLGPSTVEDRSLGKTTGTAYLTKRHKDFHAVPAEAAALRSAIRPFAIDERIQQGRGAVRATLFHLIERQSVDEYRAAAETALSTLLSPWSATVTGPWPPFAFAPELIT